MNNAAAYQPWLEAMLNIARFYRMDVSEETVRVSLAWEHGNDPDAVLRRMAGQMGLILRFEAFSEAALDPWRLPLAVELDDGQVAIIDKADAAGNLSVLKSGEQGLFINLRLGQLRERAVRVAILRPESSVADARVDDYIKPYRPDWFWRIALRDWKRYGDVLLAATVANVLALAGVIFSMQVYDRVVPAQSEPTLWVLFIGVLLAIGFEFLLRMARSTVADMIGKRADLKITDQVFGHALRLRNDARSKSTGTFIAQIRELEQVRELITSTTLGAITDLPFVLLFLVILYLTGGPLVYVALGALPLLILPGLLVQKPLARLSAEGMREAALRNALLVEAVQGIEDIKLLRAEPRFQNQWNQMHAVAADIAIKQRHLTNLLLTWTQELQSLVYVTVLLAGCYLVMRGEMTTGALVGSSILASRMMAPLAQISGIFARWQQARVARQGLDELMKRPVDQPERSRRVHRPLLRGRFTLKDVQFRYSEKDKQPALDIQHLNIHAGERVAILGRNGAGKSSLLQLLAGLHLPQRGNVVLDGLELTQIDPADVRRDIGLLTQNSRLFFGSIRDNLTLGRPMASDAEILQALTLSGALALVQSQEGGLDYLILEGGIGLSGGQKQALLLARTLLREPNTLLLDEPTATLDEVSERQVLEQLTPWLDGRTLVVATHRLAVLQWVDRVLVIDAGRIVMDGTKEQVLAHFSTQ
ncbi:type I secretion system permease/ATPase [Pseudomonas sp. CF161]|uniref:type I secretion system permease/ATPase n=1 Tax=Pseudomonas sp. CF161 TaxID=911241 RepID=UPI0003551236|nr:type I secretion system permease/ATPase [Pseudomonas sp. CF161]EPL05347.1 type I secretion membrane protein, ATP binding protein, protein export [Pseudomonas sp. CF161]